MHRPSITFYSGAVFLAGEEGQLVALGGVLAGAGAQLVLHVGLEILAASLGHTHPGHTGQGNQGHVGLHGYLSVGKGITSYMSMWAWRSSQPRWATHTQATQARATRDT